MSAYVTSLTILPTLVAGISIMLAVVVWIGEDLTGSTAIVQNELAANYLPLVLVIIASASFFLSLLLINQATPSRIGVIGLVYVVSCSIISNVALFSTSYAVIGMKSGTATVYDARDALYFSMVTFSTLGYGDFSPVPSGRIMAALQGLLGNLHLGLLAGSVFLALSKEEPREEPKTEGGSKEKPKEVPNTDGSKEDDRGSDADDTKHDEREQEINKAVDVFTGHDPASPTVSHPSKSEPPA